MNIESVLSSLRSFIRAKKTMRYSVLISAKRAFTGCPELWDIVAEEEFFHPSDLHSYIHRKCKAFLRSFPRIEGTKIELHAGTKDERDHSRKPMIILPSILPGTSHYSICVRYPNGNLQRLSEFTDAWQMEMRYGRIIQKSNPIQPKVILV